jgi:hypothetical protein
MHTRGQDFVPSFGQPRFLFSPTWQLSSNPLLCHLQVSTTTLGPETQDGAAATPSLSLSLGWHPIFWSARDRPCRTLRLRQGHTLSIIYAPRMLPMPALRLKRLVRARPVVGHHTDGMPMRSQTISAPSATPSPSSQRYSAKTKENTPYAMLVHPQARIPDQALAADHLGLRVLAVIPPARANRGSRRTLLSTTPCSTTRLPLSLTSCSSWP